MKSQVKILLASPAFQAPNLIAELHQRGEDMTRIKRFRKASHSILRVAGCLATIGLLYSPLPTPWSSIAWGQQTARPFSVQTQAPSSTPTAQPKTDAQSALGSALMACDQEEGVQPVSFPGAKGEVQLDRCYRGRERLVCSFGALSTEAKYLFDKYRKTVAANYQTLSSVGEVCAIKPDTLVEEVQNTTDFAARFKTFKAEYDARINCGTRIDQSLR